MRGLGIGIVAWAATLGCVGGYPLPLDTTLLEAGSRPELEPGRGILVVHLHTNVPIARLQISRMTALSGLDEGEHLELLVLPEGDYRWTGLVIPAGEGEVPFQAAHDDIWEFRVEAGRVSYPGELTIRGWQHARGVELGAVGIRNRSGQMLRRLRERFPGLLERYPPAYTGDKADDFLSFYGETFLAPARGAAEASR